MAEVSLEVTDWANQSGAMPDATQSTESMRPDLIASDAAFNNQSVLNFDGADVMGTGATTAWEVADDGDTTWIVVGSTTSASTLYILATEDAGGISYFEMAWRSATNSRFIVEDAGSVLITELAAPGVSGQAHVLAGVYTGAASPSNDSVELFIDGATTGPTTGDQGAISQGGSEEFLIGARRSTAVSAIVGKIAEIVILPRLITAAEDATFAGYLNARYDMSLTGVTQ